MSSRPFYSIYTCPRADECATLRQSNKEQLSLSLSRQMGRNCMLYIYAFVCTLLYSARWVICKMALSLSYLCICHDFIFHARCLPRRTNKRHTALYSAHPAHYKYNFASLFNPFFVLFLFFGLHYTA